MKISLQIWQWGSLAAGALFIWLVVIRPWRREGHITNDGMFTIAFLLAYWQDFGINWFHSSISYSSYLINYGNWGKSIPWWNNPGGHTMPEPFVLVWPIYAWFIFGGVIVGCKLMHIARARWPRMSTARLVVGCFLGWALFDLAVELLMMWSGIWVYTGSALKWETLFFDNYWRIPLHECVLWGSVWTAWTLIRFFKNDRGQTVAERGIDQVHVGRRSKSIIRLLALTGIVNLCLVGYNLSYYPFYETDLRKVLPHDLLSRSYFTHGVCEPGCPGSTKAAPVSRFP